MTMTDKFYYVKKKNDAVCIRQSQKAVPFVDFDDDDIKEILAPVPIWEEYKKLKYANDMFISQVPDTGLDKKLIEQEQEIEFLNAVRKGQENNIENLLEKVKLLKAALKYSNSTVKWVLPLIETAYDARIMKVVEEMLNKTNEVLR